MLLYKGGKPTKQTNNKLVPHWLLARDQVKRVISPQRLSGFFRRRILRCVQNLVRQLVPFKCMGF